MNETFYTVDEFAEILKVHPQTIRKAIKRGRIQAFRAGYGKRSRLRISHEELGRMRIMDAEATALNLISLRNKK